MMKLKSIYILAVAVLLAFTACEDDDFTGYGSMTPVEGVVATIVPEGDGTYLVTDEAETEVELVINLNKAQNVDLMFNLSKTGGDAVAGTDFDMPASVTIPAGELTDTSYVTILANCDDIAEKTLQITIGDERNGNVEFTAETMDFTITNVKENDEGTPAFNLTHSWNLSGDDAAKVSANESGYDFLDNDIEIYDADFNYYGGSFTGGEESLQVTAPEAGKQYFIYAYTYAVTETGEIGPFTYPSTMSFSRCGSFEEVTVESVTYDETELQGQIGSYPDITQYGTYTLIGYYVYSDGTFKVYDADDNLLFEEPVE
ncbi:hypothetical protein OO013_13810 [Mangrovivirga sp. M17]|uniref:Calx-beta domain-containing protein n=1 Tax=Mangrovivirga halotolerans TaxID=2993936 RepID=A0ABT3RT35_9BACT|nr:hypothetical protein [Mangrovivirga halotolerans]MCX2744953.1 hypothetical protein [Mangrovivirga halotolerans]